MTMKPREAIVRPPDMASLGGSLAHYAKPQGPDLLARTDGFGSWIAARRDAGVWPYSRSLEGAASTRNEIRYDNGQRGSGLNYASQDYLSLASHPSLRAAAREAVEAYGVHSAGSPALLGNTEPSLRLEQELGDWLQYEQVTLFPTGWAAGFGTVAALVRPYDHVVLDEYSHACLHSGVQSATRNIHRTRHLDNAAIRDALEQIRTVDTRNAILVITEGLFSMDSDSPKIREMQSICREFSATLMVDVAHDLGALGEQGTGQIGKERLLGEIDLVMGSFSKTFASNGGFLACNSPHVKQYVKSFGGPHTFSNAFSPVQAETVLQALRIVRSAEGAARRERLLTAVNALRDGFAKVGIVCMGDPSAIVPVPAGAEDVARIASKLMFDRGVLANLVEFPAVAVGAARFRMQVMADHSPEQAREAAGIVAGALADASSVLESWRLQDQGSQHA